MKKIQLKIVTPERVVVETMVDSVTVMTQMGEVTVLPNHVPLVAALQPGELRMKVGGEESFLVSSTGFLQVRGNNEGVILSDTAERVSELEL